MARTTAAEREIAAHRVDLLVDTRLGIAESHRMQSWEVSARAGDIAAAYRDRTGSHMFRLRVRWVALAPNRTAIRIEPGEGCTAYRRAGLVTA